VSIKIADFSVSGLSKEALFEHLKASIKVHICFDDRDHKQLYYKESLNGFWKLVNVLQFLPDVSWTSRKVVLDPTSAQTALPIAVAAQAGSTSLEWDDLIDRSLLAGDLSLLATGGFAPGEDGYELVQGDEVTAVAELAWPTAKVALFCADELADKTVFEQGGWQCFVDPVNPQLITELSKISGVS
jgi:DEAD/DEAH box helicase domain-containing protein